MEFAEMRGDWKFLKEALHLQEHYLAVRVCHRRSACKWGRHAFYSHFGVDAPLRRTLRRHDDWAQAQERSGHPTPLLNLPRFNVERAMFDVMHTLDLGVMQHAVCSALHELTRGDEATLFDGADVAARVLAATRAYHAWCAQRRVPDVAKRITEKWVKAPFPCVGMHQCKAAAMRHMVFWLRDVLAPARRSSPEAHYRWGFFQEVCESELVMRASGRFLRKSQQRKLARRVQGALHMYMCLHERARARGVALYKVIPKLHAWSHLAYDNGGVNPRSAQCYADEDVVGKMKRLYVKRHARSAPNTALRRYVLQQSMHWLQELTALHPALRPPP